MRVVWSERAADDVVQIVSFLAKSGLGEEAAARIFEGVSGLAEFPELGMKVRIRPRGRRLIISFRSWAYVLRYRLRPGEVFVERVLDSRRIRQKQ